MSRLLAVAIAILTIGTTTAFGSLVVTQDAAAQEVELTAEFSTLQSSTSDLAQRRQAWEAQRQAIDEQIADAEGLLASSNGKVADDAARTILSDAITTAKADATAADSALQLVDEQTRDAFPATAPADAAALHQVASDVQAVALPVLNIDLSDEMNDVEVAIAAWTAEQARIEAAKKAAAEQAAREAAAAKPSQSSSPNNSGGGSNSHTEYVWTSGGQSQIDACKGSVIVSSTTDWLRSARSPGIIYVAEHNYCGGKSWYDWGVGTRVTFSGQVSGVFEVVNKVRVNGTKQSAADIPEGGDLYYQTCYNGYSDMGVWVLVRVG